MKSDSFWKELLEQLFREFVQFFFPEIHRDIDFGKGYQFLDKEFQQITKGSKAGRKIVDKLVKVFLKDGREQWLLIHIEIQGQKEEDFARRMFTYNYRIFDKYQREVISLALLTDKDRNYRPNAFSIKRWGFECVFKFPLVKIIDYIGYAFEREYGKNIFSIIVEAFLKTLETEGDYQGRYHWKRRFILQLYDLGLDRETLIRVYKFIEWIMELPKSLDDRLYEEVKQKEEQKRMPYIMYAERKGIQKGIQKGKQEGKQEGRIEGLRQAIKILMDAKFGQSAKGLEEKISKVRNEKTLEKILYELQQAVDADEFEQNLVRKKLM